MKKWSIPQMKQVTEFLIQYRYVLLMMMAGVILLLLPSGTGVAVAEDVTTQIQEDQWLEELEVRLADTLSLIEGAGETQVMLTLADDGQRIVAQDVEDSATVNVIVTGADKGEDVVELQTVTPTFRGALVVCQGGDDPQVQLQIMAAVSALTGLGSNKIAICTAQ